MPENHPHPRIVIAGAGAIGNYIGVQLHKAGVAVTFLGSKRMGDIVNARGLVFEYPDHSADRFSPHELAFSDVPSCVCDCNLVIVAVKSLVTETLIAQIKPHLRTQTTLLTVQNGISNASKLKQAFPQNTVLAGMVTFNVIEKPLAANAPVVFRLTTHGEIYIEKHTPSLLPLFGQAHCATKELDNIDSMLWSKLLLNLVNPLNALSGKSLKQNLEDREFRLQWAVCMREGLAVLEAAGIKPAKVTPLPPHMLPFMVSLPNWIYLFLARNMTDMDPDAKSSMAQDLEKGNPTEIDFLSGEIIHLGRKVGVPTPENEKVYRTIKNRGPVSH